MRIVTFNLAGGDKRAVTADLDADVVFLQERRQVDVVPGELWSGSLHFKGLSVRGRAPIAPMAVADDVARYFVPYEVSAPDSFQLIHVWAQNDGADRYVRGICRSVDVWAERIARRPTVIAGDFNANQCWDHEHPADRCFSALARRLEELGLVSAYHAFYRETFGAETRPTFFLYRHEAKAFHLDYCFIPQAWLRRLRSVTVGTWAEWNRISDHVPLTVELE